MSLAAGDGAPESPPAPPPPSLLIVSLPKSGTVFLNATFHSSLGLANRPLCNGYFPADVLALDRVRGFVADGGAIAASHLPASPVNLQILDALVPRWVVHLRDPRASLLSWVHHIRGLHAAGHDEMLLLVTPAPPVSVLEGPLPACIAWHIDGYFRAAVAWVRAWTAATDARADRVLLTEFAALAHAEEPLCRRIAAFVEHDPARYQHRTPPRTAAAHFRNGALDEWARAFTPAQIAASTALIPPDLARRFGWRMDQPTGGTACVPP
jgi:hypothetical protein